MPVSQTGSNVGVYVKAQTAIGSPASGAGAMGLRLKASQSIKLAKAMISSEEIRLDGQTTRGRSGSRSGSATFPMELSLGLIDTLMEAVSRGTITAQATIAATVFTSISTTTSSIVGASGSFLAQAIRRGDMIKLAGSHTAGNNGKWIRVVDVAAGSLTLPTGSLALDATADTGASIIVAKNVIQGQTPVERYFTVEENQRDIDASLLMTDAKITKLDFNAQPNKNIEVSITFMGLDVQPLTGAGAPVFTSPVYTTALPMIMADGIIRILGVDYNVLTGFQFSLDLGGTNTPTLSAAGVDIFLSNAKLTGSFTAIRRDLAFFTAFSAETTVEFFILCSENEADPKDFCSWYIGNAVLSDASTGIAASGPMLETIPWEGGKDEVGGAHAPTMLKFATSAP